ncbi:hypothetical protein BJ986_003153 [Phycicoccus badiiscoriae]|uniref:Uncharacterized protein n=1 Tax=Pedococcus badiiscoriae TaxID=642776 RepID=A0A852WTU7_9MICO|nr:hypothetical protein [Pedococcus badiiscoriae]NYG08666.1 hypothetical protein [Pedococcus badiiscoriae]
MERNQSAEASSARPLAARVGAAICAGLALLLTVATGVVTFGLSESYGFGPVWDWSALMMTGAAAALVGTALLVAIRLARLRWPAVSLTAGVVAFVFAVGYIAGVAGDSLKH